MTTTTAFTAGAVVVGVDGSSSSHEAVVWGAQQAALEHRRLTLVHAYHLENAAWVAQAGSTVCRYTASVVRVVWSGES